MRHSILLTTVARILFPFVILFGFYVILNGSLSPGGGFQGGAIMATGILTTFFARPSHSLNTKKLIKIEKYLFLALVLLVLTGFLLGGNLFMNPARSPLIPVQLNTYLIFLNLILGMKVTLGLTAIVCVFFEEGE